MAGEFAVAVFDPSGKFHHGYGDWGKGPEEFSHAPIPMIVRMGSGDTVYVMQGPYLHILGPQATSTSSKRLVRIVANDAVIVGATPVLQAPVGAPDGLGTPVQIVRRDGAIDRGIGITSARPMLLTSPFDHIRRLGRAPGREAVWSSYVNRFEMSRFDLDGREELRVERSADWFPEYEDEVPGEIVLVPSRPRVEGVVELTGGLLWVVVSHADERMEAATPVTPPASEVPVPSDLDCNKLLDTTIEVIDLNVGEISARRRFDEYLRIVDSTENQVLLYAMRETQSLDLACEVFVATLEQ